MRPPDEQGTYVTGVLRSDDSFPFGQGSRHRKVGPRSVGVPRGKGRVYNLVPEKLSVEETGLPVWRAPSHVGPSDSSGLPGFRDTVYSLPVGEDYRRVRVGVTDGRDGTRSNHFRRRGEAHPCSRSLTGRSVGLLGGHHGVVGGGGVCVCRI